MGHGAARLKNPKNVNIVTKITFKSQIVLNFGCVRHDSVSWNFQKSNFLLRKKSSKWCGFPLFWCLTTLIFQEKLSICNFSDFSIFFAKLTNDVKGVCFYSKTEKAPYRKISQSTLKYLKKSLFNSNFKKYQKSKKEMFSILLIFLKKIKKKKNKKNSIQKIISKKMP